MTSNLWERIPQNAREKRPDASDFTSIPTEDPRAAFQFCQSLAHMLAGGSNPALNYTRQRQIAEGIKLHHLFQNINWNSLSLFQSSIMLLDFASNPLSKSRSLYAGAL